MEDNNHDREEPELPHRKRMKALVNTAVGVVHDLAEDESPKHSLTSSQAQRQLQVAATIGPSDFRHPGSPGIFFESQIPELSLTSVIARTEINTECRIDDVHDSEFEDIYTLYNACNGVVRDGFLDVRKLDELTQEERGFLNVERLIEIWIHTTSGCETCAGIINTLNSVRGILADEEEDAQSEPVPAISQFH